jgi:hypothetical protein
MHGASDDVIAIIFVAEQAFELKGKFISAGIPSLPLDPLNAS